MPTRTSLFRQTLYGACSVTAALALWEVCARNLNYPPPNVIPSPAAVLRLLGQPESIMSGVPTATNAYWYLTCLTMRTVSRVLVGMLIGVVISFPLGLLIGLTLWGRVLIRPLVLLLAPLSPIAWITFAILLIPTEGGVPVFLVFISVVFLLSLATANAVMNVDVRLIRVARSLGASRWQEILRVLVPASLPSVFIVLRINFFAAWMAVLVAEAAGLTQEQWGIGNLIWQAKQSYNRELALLGMAVLSLSGFILDRCLLLMQDRFLWWRRDLTVACE